MAKIGDAFIELRAKFNKLNKDLNKAFGGIERKSKKTNTALTNQFNKLGGVIAGAFAAQQVADFAVEAVKLASVAEGVERAFARLNDPMLLSNLTEATRGTVSQLDLMKQAVQANNLGVPIENLASLFEFATQRAADTGEAVDHLVQSIVTGIGRKSPLILDNLGISAIDLKAQLNGVGLETASVGDIAEAVGKIASKSMADIGETSLTSAQKIAQMGAQIENLKVEIGEGLLPVLFAFMEVTNETIKSVKTLFNSDASFVDVFRSYLELLVPTMLVARLGVEKLAESTDEAAKEVEQFDQNVKTLDQTTQDANRTFDFITGTWNEAAAQVEILSSNVQTFAEHLEGLATVKTDKVFDFLKGEWVDKVLPQAALSIGALEEKIKDLEEQAKNTTNLEDYLAIMQQISGLQSKIDKITTRPKEEIVDLPQKGLPTIPGATGSQGLVINEDTYDQINQWDEAARKAAETTEFWNTQTTNLATSFGGALTQGFAAAISGSGNFFQMMGDYLKQLAIQLAATAAAALILNALLGGAGLAIGGFGSFKESFGTLFGGGGGFGGFGGGGGIIGGIRGRDTVLSYDRSQQFNTRTTGIR